MADKATADFEAVRLQVAGFIGAGQKEEIIFTKGSTESINLVAFSFGEAFIQPGDEIIVSEMEHHSNFLPWQNLRDEKGIVLKVIPLTATAELDLEKAKTLGDKLVVIVNSDHQRIIKGSKEFMDENERMLIVKALRCVDEVILSVDKDGTVCESLKLVKPDIFAKGGDRFSSEIPEAKVCHDLEIIMVDGLGNKIQSSSWLLKK
jgi:hypothetical protein